VDGNSGWIGERFSFWLGAFMGFAAGITDAGRKVKRAGRDASGTKLTTADCGRSQLNWEIFSIAADSQRRQLAACATGTLASIVLGNR
jgi:hypothetical protein